MLIDTHCHFDMLPHPEEYIYQADMSGEILLGMTNLPSHFKLGLEHVIGLKHVKLAIGFHPLLVKKNKSELPLFLEYLNDTQYVGEIGLDFSDEGYFSKDVQIKSLRVILSQLRTRNKIISIHSRRAERQTLDLLKEYQINNVIFHWYSGPIYLIKEIEDAGYYFSINESMTRTLSGRRIIKEISKERILTETDIPYNDECNITKALININMKEDQIKNNFYSLLSGAGHYCDEFCDF